MDILVSKAESVQTEQIGYVLQYDLLKNEYQQGEGKGGYYGIRIIEYNTVNLKDKLPSLVEEIQGISDNLEEVLTLFEQLSSGTVMPENLPEIIDDWHSAFHPHHYQRKTA